MTATLVPFEEVLERYDPALGLEVHVELNTATKMFCGCPASFGEEPNTRVCPVCLGHPGTLPVTNAEAEHYALMIAMAFGFFTSPGFFSATLLLVLVCLVGWAFLR